MSVAIFAKFLLNGIIAGSMYAVLASGLALIYGVMRFVNLAHGEIAILGGYSFFVFYSLVGWPLIPSLIAGMGLLFIFILIIEKLTFLPLRDAPSLIPLIASMAVGMFIKNLLLLIFKQKPHSFTDSATSIPLFSDIVRITDVQIIIIIVSILIMIGLTLFLKRTKTGQAIRAVADNKETAAILGIPVNRIITITFLISGFLAGTAGILFGFDQNIHPAMASFLTIKALAAVIVGGIGSIPGAVLGGYLIGIAENILIAIPFGSFQIPSNYKDAIAFALIIVLLYVKPSGIFGSASESAHRK